MKKAAERIEVDPIKVVMALIFVRHVRQIISGIRTAEDVKRLLARLEEADKMLEEIMQKEDIA